MFDDGEEHVSSRWAGQAPFLPGQLCSKQGWAQAPGSETGAGLFVGNRLHSQTVRAGGRKHSVRGTNLKGNILRGANPARPAPRCPPCRQVLFSANAVPALIAFAQSLSFEVSGKSPRQSAGLEKSPKRQRKCDFGIFELQLLFDSWLWVFFSLHSCWEIWGWLLGDD